MFYTYIIQSKKDGRWYTGCTNDLRKRFKQHNNGEVSSTKGRGPFELIYYEACRNEQDAFAREKYLKSGPGKQYLKKRLKRFLSLTGSSAWLWIKIFRNITIILLIFSWIFGGWPSIRTLDVLRFPPKIQEATSTPLESITPALSSEDQVSESSAQEEDFANVVSPSSPLAILKERKIQKEIKIDKFAKHRCDAETFRLDISGRTIANSRLDLNGEGGEIEIGSLPAGIDITFSKNKDYLYQPQNNETALDLQITNETDSQKGSFSVPIIYTSGNSTTICQINIINF
ncbi:GIY-YIG nuclease family protein [Patescibacteria group bacterium]|nr:GIY-YIG nuclease family protein [Patescibacteria group bacterium]MBU4579604.1 GIY-YIG nuclease family protein [Patescibacteria group bacterium]